MKSLNVNPLEFRQVLGYSDSRISYLGCDSFNIGEPVMVNEVSVIDRKPTGMVVKRYVVAIENPIALLLDDDSFTLRLSPFAPTSAPLGLSGVRS